MPKGKLKSRAATAKKPSAERASHERIQSSHASDAAITPERIAATRHRLPPIPNDDIAALDAAHTPEDFDTAGKATQSAAVETDALRFLVVAEEQIRTHGDLIECDPVVLSYLDHAIVDLQHARAAAASAPRDAGARRDVAVKAARNERIAVFNLIKRVVGSDATLGAKLATARGVVSDDASVTQTLGQLIEVGRQCVQSHDAKVRARCRIFRLDTARLDAAARVHLAAVNATANALGANSSQKDPPAVNRAEGRVLYAMKTLYDIFEAAHEKDALVRRLIPSAATRAVVAPHPAGAGTKAPGASTAAGDANGASGTQAAG